MDNQTTVILWISNDTRFSDCLLGMSQFEAKLFMGIQNTQDEMGKAESGNYLSNKKEDSTTALLSCALHVSCSMQVDWLCCLQFTKVTHKYFPCRSSSSFSDLHQAGKKTG